MPRGGARPGAGRKRKRVYPGQGDPSALGPIKAAEAKLRAALPDLVDVAITAARDGDRRLLIYCIDRVLGSPVQPVELEIHRAAVRLAAATGADPDWLVKRAQEIAQEAASAQV